MGISSVNADVSAVTYTFTSDGGTTDSLTLREASSTLAIPRICVLRRVFPKKTSSYPGNARNYAKLTWNIEDADGVVTPLICEFQMSRRADMSTTDVALARKLLAQLVLEGELDDFFNHLAL
jgi:hypothetical protein